VRAGARLTGPLTFAPCSLGFLHMQRAGENPIVLLFLVARVLAR
jgi:hypothetical protein